MPEDPAAAAAFAGQLLPGEQLLWSGQPTAAGLFFANLWGLVGTLVWAALATVGLVTAIATHAAAAFAASGFFLLVMLFGLYRQARRASAGKHQFYAITDGRILSLDTRRPGDMVVVMRAMTHDSEREPWLYGKAARGRIRSGRANVRIPYKAYTLGGRTTGPGYRLLDLDFVAGAGRRRRGRPHQRAQLGWMRSPSS